MKQIELQKILEATLLIGIVALLGLFALVPKTGGQQPEVLASEDVTVTATVTGCILNLTVIPEKRIPATNNWATDINVQIFDNPANTYQGEFNATTDSAGDAVVNLCDEGIALEGGTYDFYIKGLSHLRKNFDSFSGFTAAAPETFDFSVGGTELLLAGETSTVYDNYINVLDLATQVNVLETASNKNDLNQDGEVNTLDLSNTIFNFYAEGDCSPKEITDGICN